MVIFIENKDISNIKYLKFQKIMNKVLYESSQTSKNDDNFPSMKNMKTLITV